VAFGVYPSFIILQEQPVSQLTGLLIPVIMLGAMYLLLILPMQRQKKQQKAMLDGLKTGDLVVTNGGLVGTIHSMDAERDTLVLSCRPSNTKLEVARTAVAGVVNDSK
jgi:preprotein translocase subunit YajC